jgi:thiamine monophosphate synthase
VSIVKLDRYVALALQVDCDGVHVDSSREQAALRMRRSLERIDRAVLGAKR